MAVYMRNGVFVHIPKTGGTWIHRLSEESGLCIVYHQYKPGDKGIPFGESEYKHYVPTLKEVNNRWVFLTVRNPITWLRSYYHHRKSHNFDWEREPLTEDGLLEKKWGRPLSYDIDDKCKASNLIDFINNVIAHPNIVYEFFDSFISKYHNYQKVFIGKQEDLREDYIKFLQLTGETFDPNIIRNFPSRYQGKIDEQIPEKLQEAIMKSEAMFFEKHEYPLKTIE